MAWAAVYTIRASVPFNGGDRYLADVMEWGRRNVLDGPFSGAVQAEAFAQ
jgi:hypothetical protein